MEIGEPVESPYANDGFRVVLKCGNATAREVVPSAINAVHVAIVENWKRLSQWWPPDFEVEFSEAQVESVVAEIEKEGGCFYSCPPYLPISNNSLYFTFKKCDNSVFVIELAIPRATLNEVEGSGKRGKMAADWHMTRYGKYGSSLPRREDLSEEEFSRWYEDYNRLGNTPSLWPQIRQCFLNLVEHLKAVLPVTRLEIDKHLRA